MKPILTVLMPLLLAACGVYLPEQITIDTRGPSHRSPRPERDADGLIRTERGECLDIHGNDRRSLIRHRCHGQANQLFRLDAKSGTIRQNERCLDVARHPVPMQRPGQPALVSRRRAHPQRRFGQMLGCVRKLSRHPYLQRQPRAAV